MLCGRRPGSQGDDGRGEGSGRRSGREQEPWAPGAGGGEPLCGGARHDRPPGRSRMTGRLPEGTRPAGGASVQAASAAAGWSDSGHF